MIFCCVASFKCLSLIPLQSRVSGYQNQAVNIPIWIKTAIPPVLIRARGATLMVQPVSSNQGGPC